LTAALTRNMHALYGKAFAKKAVDLNKNDFYGKHNYKATIKGKTSDCSYEINGSDEASKEGKYEAANAKLTVPLDAGFEVTVDSKASGDTTMTGSYKVSDAIKTELELKNPGFPIAGSSMAVSGTVTMLDPGYSAEIKFAPISLKTMQLDDKCGASVAAAFPCPGMENITVGVVPAINFSTKKLNAAFSIGGGDKTFQLALCGGVADLGASRQATQTALKGFFKVNDLSNAAFEITSGTHTLDDKCYWKAAGEAKSSATEFKVGADYKFSDSTTAKGKVTFGGGKPVFDFAASTALAGKSKLAAGVKLGGGAPSVGLTYTLE